MAYWYEGYELLKDFSLFPFKVVKPCYHLVYEGGYEELLYFDYRGFKLIAWYGLRPVWNGPLNLKKVEALDRDSLPLFISFDVLTESFREHLKGTHE